MEVIVSKGRLLTYKIHIAADLKFTFRNERNNFHRIWNEVIHCFEATILYCHIRNKPGNYISCVENFRLRPDLSQSDLVELVMIGGKSDPQNVPISVE